MRIIISLSSCIRALLLATSLALAGHALTACAEDTPKLSSVPQPPDIEALDTPVAEVIHQAISNLRAAPDDPHRWIELASVYHAHDMFDLALPCYEQAHGKGMNEARLWYLRAFCERELGRTDDALRHIERARMLSPDASWVWWRSGLWTLDAGRLDDAEAHFRKAIELDPVDPGGALGLARLLMLQGRNDEAARTLRSLLESTESERGYATYLLRRAEQHHDQTQPRHAALPPRPRWSDPWIDDIRRRNRSAQYFHERARLLIENGKVDEAIQLLESTMPYWSERLSMAIQLAIAYRTAHRFDDALRVLDPLLAAHPDSHVVHLNVARTIIEQIDAAARATPEQLDRAEHHVRRGLELAPDASALHAVRADLFQLRGEFDAAAASYARAAELDPSLALWAYRAAGAFASAGRFADALPWARRVVSAHPTMPDAWHRLGRILAALDRLDEAESALAKAVELEPGRAEFQRDLHELQTRRQGSP